MTRFLVSVTIADILDRKHCFPEMLRISSMASMVSSAEVVVSKKMAIKVASPSLELNTSLILSGSTSTGTDRSATESYQMTCATWSTFSMSVLRLATSLYSMPSQTNSA